VTERAAEQVDDARFVLESLRFDAERSNERSAMVLLALLRLRANDPWSAAQTPMLGTRAIMDWIRDEYGVDYKPNTREIVRRFTLHQFVDAGLVEENPDEPARPVNSPKWCYRVRSEAVPTLKAYGTDRFDGLLDTYLEAAASHGPVDGRRHSELSTLFADSTAGLVYVSCFPSRVVMRKYLAQIAWETEVWCADDPTHLIHFNGERFLGPYR
jgi:hypothetical protein